MLDIQYLIYCFGFSKICLEYKNSKKYKKGIIIQQTKIYLNIFHCKCYHSGNLLTIRPFPLWMSHSKLIIVLVIVFLNEY